MTMKHVLVCFILTLGLVSYSQAEAMNAKLSGKTECKFISHDDDVHGIHKQDFEPINEWLGNE